MFTRTIIQLGEKLFIDTESLRDLCVKMVILNLSFVDRQSLLSLVFPDTFVDWDLVPDASSGVNSVGDLDLWVSFLEQCKWDGMVGKTNLPMPIVDMRNGLRAAEVNCDNWSLVCKLLVVHMLIGSQSLNAFQVVMCRSDLAGSRHKCAELLAYLSDQRHLPQEHERAFEVILSPDVLTVDTKSMETIVCKMRSRLEERQLFQQMRELTVAGGRPRLRDRQHKTSSEQLELDVNLSTWESFHGWSLLHQFPNVLSESVKYRLYFLSAQTSFDWRPLVAVALGRECDLSTRITQYPVSKPELGALSKVIGELRMKGDVPFPELLLFKRECFRGFPMTVMQHMTLTQVLRLYVCAYQNPSVWRDLWKQHASLLSPQIIRDCRTFADSTPFAGEAVLKLMMK